MKIYWLVAVAALLHAGGASAQGRSGITEVPLTNVKPYRELQAFGVCLARGQRKDALALMATLPDSPEEKKILKQVAYGDEVACLFGGTKMTMPNLFARGAIAEGLLRTGGVPDTHRLSSPSPPEVRDLHGVARCYTSGHRAEVENLLKTHPGSREELKAVAGLWEGFRTCMPNFTVRLNAPWIRFLLAEALLRVSPNPNASGPMEAAE